MVRHRLGHRLGLRIQVRVRARLRRSGSGARSGFQTKSGSESRLVWLGWVRVRVRATPIRRHVLHVYVCVRAGMCRPEKQQKAWVWINIG